jgi:hypothetical protein
MPFHNRRYFTRQSFDILGSSVKVHRKGLFDEIEYEIPFDQIHNKMTIQTQINNNIIVTGIFFMVFSFLFLLGTAQELTVIFLSIGVIFVVAALINKKKAVIVPNYGGEAITLFFSSRNKNEVVEFGKQIIIASNNYLLQKYGKLDRDLPIAPQIEHLQFLLNREIINESEFESLKNQLLGRDHKSAIGFGQ